MLYLFTNARQGKTVTVDAHDETAARRSLHEIVELYFPTFKVTSFKLADVRPFVASEAGHKNHTHMQRTRKRAGKKAARIANQAKRIDAMRRAQKARVGK